MTTQADLDALVAAYRQGVETVRFADRTVTYRSRSDMAQIIAETAAALGVANPLASAAGRSRASFAAFRRG